MIHMSAVAVTTGKYVHIRFTCQEREQSDPDRKTGAGSLILTPNEWVALRGRLNNVPVGPDEDDSDLTVDIKEITHARSA